MLNVSVTHCHCGISHLVTSFHHINFTLIHLTISTSHGHIPRHTIIPHHIAHFISHQHLSQHTNTIFKIAPLISATLCITPHLALHPILHYVPHNATFHVLHATFKITPYIGHIMHHTTTSRHHTTFYTTDIVAAPHSASASFHHITQSDHTQSTAHYHVSTFHITHQYTTIYTSDH